MANDKKNDAATLTTLMDRLPLEVEGWKRSERIDIYNPDNLYEYINGGAELYISYQFRHVAARTYRRENQPEIKVDVFDMGEAWGAFGVFAQSRETVDDFVGLGIESEYAAGLLTFWKDRYYVSILAYPENAQRKGLVKTLAGHLARAIPGKGAKPAIVDRLPVKGMVPESLRYFRHHMWVNSEFFIAEQDILMIRDGAEAVLARYDTGAPDKKKSVLLVVNYPTEQRARDAAASFRKYYLDNSPEGIKQLENKRWTGFRLDGKTLVLLFNAHRKQVLEALLALVS